MRAYLSSPSSDALLPPFGDLLPPSATQDGMCCMDSMVTRFMKFHVSASGSERERKLAVKKRKSSLKIDFSGEKPAAPLLGTINYPVHMKNLSTLEYAHKILTGRRSRMHIIRQTSGLVGFPKRDESVHDAFGAGHSSTSISAGLGMSVARDLLRKRNHVISVIGDGAMTTGQAYEAMNNTGYLDSNLIVVLNDSKQVSLPTATLDGPATPVRSPSFKPAPSSESFATLQRNKKIRTGTTPLLVGLRHIREKINLRFHTGSSF